MKKKNKSKILKNPKRFWTKLFIILLALTIIDWSIPDPLILIDELILSIGTIGGLFKVVQY